MLGSARITKACVSGTDLLVHRVSALQEGRSVVITANLHGDECTGIAVVFRLLETLPSLIKQGEVHLYPSLNPEGLMERKRIQPSSGLDLNRLFPGRSNGNHAERYLFSIWSDICGRQPDALLDLHTDSYHSVPYALVDRVVKGGELQDHCWQMAVASGIVPVLEYPKAIYLKYNLDRSLAGVAVNRLGIPSVTLEVGPRRSLDMKSVDICYDAVLAMLAHLGIISPGSSSQWSPFDSPNLRREQGPLVHQPGVFLPEAQLGVMLAAGDKIGRHYDVNGTLLQELAMPVDGMVLSLPDSAFLGANQSCATLAVRDI